MDLIFEICFWASVADKNNINVIVQPHMNKFGLK